ncbi:S9 family peptidase [Sandaracinobacter sp. RS1-74]|uniref:S9 family peptidase n=1 Tax=Sandaracinobacteroides sayramensis TaxID=2913411 RepID=UPI001EDAEB52|nr:DPP IV N-terminal domain-containing protein [Sandaracinobacteroides sayramensis]MCG2841404.1 S9 family peptidase [Sandaracinobacteroides sayramensis]
MRQILLGLLLATAPAQAAQPAQPLTLERLFANPPLLGTPPRALSIAPDGRHIAWLQPRATDQLRYDLWVEEIASGKRRMAVDSLALSSGPASLSEAELMRRERARLASVKGLVEYQWSPDGRSLLVPLDGDIWLAPLKGAPRRLTETEATELDAKLSPKGTHASFVREQNLVVLDLATARERQLTTGGGGPVSYGVAEFVAQEEMDRMTGQWWAPDDKRIAIARVDESPVKIAVRTAIGSDGTRVTEQRYPFAGTPNALVTLEIHGLDGAAPVQVDLGADSDIYLARVHWLNTGQLLVQRQSRDQRTLDLLLVEAATGRSRVLLTERSATWINLHDSLRPLADGKRFLWASERSGHRHLYLWDGAALRPVTSGDWSVDELLAVDEAKGSLIFTGFRETPLEKALYRTPLAGGAVERLTAPGGWTEAVADRKGSALLLAGSTPEKPATVTLATTDGGPLKPRQQISPTDFPYAASLPAHVAPRFGTLKAADGQTELHYAFTLPPGLKPGEKAPVFFEVYAGPGVQRVRHAFGTLLHQYLLQQGWALFQVDGRGTPNRGTAFEAPIHLKLGFPEVDDQMAALEWLKRQPGVDPDRVAVYGWSYGGYMAQRLLTRHPGAFAAGVSGAPVTDWRLYDTHYTERYLGNPATDPKPYEASDVTRDAAALKDPLLVIHGLADDNVVFDHSARAIAAYQQAGKPFETMVYPGQTHAIRAPDIQRHLWRTILNFLDREVKAKKAE